MRNVVLFFAATTLSACASMGSASTAPQLARTEVAAPADDACTRAFDSSAAACPVLGALSAADSQQMASFVRDQHEEMADQESAEAQSQPAMMQATDEGDETP
jgi:hypothetical protein